MNNSKIVLDSLNAQDTSTDALKDREAKLVRIIDSIKRVTDSPEWSSLKTEVFDGLVEEYKKTIFTEARKEHPDLQVLAKANGKFEVAKKYQDLLEFARPLQTELTNIRTKIYGQSER